MSNARETIFVGSRRFVTALDAQSGEEVWRTKFPSGTSSMVTLLLKGGRLFVGHSDRAYCLDSATGEILWRNELPKSGYDPVLLVMEGAGECVLSAGVAAGAEAEAAVCVAT